MWASFSIDSEAASCKAVVELHEKDSLHTRSSVTMLTWWIRSDNGLREVISVSLQRHAYQHMVCLAAERLHFNAQSAMSLT